MKKFVTYVITGISSILFSSCANNIEVKTGEAHNITANSAEILCSVEANHLSDIDEFGVLFSTSEETIEAKAGYEAKTTECSDNTYTVSLYLSGLNDEAPKPGTKFYYCGYVISGHDYYYGDIKSFSTPK